MAAPTFCGIVGSFFQAVRSPDMGAGQFAEMADRSHFCPDNVGMVAAHASILRTDE